MPPVESKNFANADEVVTFPNGRIELLHVSGGTVARMTFQPGWRWSTDERPIVGTDWCEVPHFLFVASGHVQIKMKNGAETLLGPGFRGAASARARRLGRRQRAGCRRRLVRHHRRGGEQVVSREKRRRACGRLGPRAPGLLSGRRPVRVRGQGRPGMVVW